MLPIFISILLIVCVIVILKITRTKKDYCVNKFDLNDTVSTKLDSNVSDTECMLLQQVIICNALSKADIEHGCVSTKL